MGGEARLRTSKETVKTAGGETELADVVVCVRTWDQALKVLMKILKWKQKTGAKLGRRPRPHPHPPQGGTIYG